MLQENEHGTREPFTHCSSLMYVPHARLCPSIIKRKRYCRLFFIAPLLWTQVMDFYCITFKLSDMQLWFRSWDFSACKVSASDILQGHGAALARIFFQDFGVRWLLVQILVPPKVKNYSAISCLKCLLLALGKAA